MKGIRATPVEEDMGAELENITRDVTNQAVVSDDVVDVDVLYGRASRKRLGNGLDGATRLRYDKRSETTGLQHRIIATHTKNRSRLRRSLRIWRRREFWTTIRGRIWSGGIR